MHDVWLRLYDSPEFLELRCDLVDEGFEVHEREKMLCDFLDWDEDDACPSPVCPGEAEADLAKRRRTKPKLGPA